MRNFYLTVGAEDDLTNIWLYTCEAWGFDQAEKYFSLIEECCEAIGSGKARIKPFEGIPHKIHVHRCEQHYIFLILADRPVILAILHGRMDFIRQIQNRLA